MRGTRPKRRGEREGREREWRLCIDLMRRGDCAWRPPRFVHFHSNSGIYDKTVPSVMNHLRYAACGCCAVAAVLDLSGDCRAVKSTLSDKLHSMCGWRRPNAVPSKSD